MKLRLSASWSPGSTLLDARPWGEGAQKGPRLPRSQMTISCQLLRVWLFGDSASHGCAHLHPNCHDCARVTQISFACTVSQQKSLTHGHCCLLLLSAFVFETGASLCSSGWCRTHKDLPTSASGVLGSKSCATMPPQTLSQDEQAYSWLWWSCL